MRTIRFVALAGVFVATGCNHVRPAWVRDDFSQSLICPTERLEVLERKDLQAADLIAADRTKHPIPTPAPPADIANDPERVALWRSTLPKPADPHDFDSYQVFEVNGCGTHGMYACTRQYVVEGVGPDATAGYTDHSSCTRVANLNASPDASTLATAIEEWAKAVCACADLTCVTAASGQLQQHVLSEMAALQRDPTTTQEWMPLYTQAVKRGQQCVQKLGGVVSTPGGPLVPPVP